jgi:hypothetical protein
LTLDGDDGDDGDDDDDDDDDDNDTETDNDYSVPLRGTLP